MAFFPDRYDAPVNNLPFALFAPPMEISARVYYAVLKEVREKLGEKLAKLSKQKLQRMIRRVNEDYPDDTRLALVLDTPNNVPLRLKVVGIKNGCVHIHICFPISNGVGKKHSELFRRIKEKFGLDTVSITNECAMEMLVSLVGTFYEPKKIELRGPNRANGHPAAGTIEEVDELHALWNKLNLR